MCVFLLRNAYVLEADLLISNPKIIKKHRCTSDSLGIRVGRSNDWCFTVKDGVIVEEKMGGLDCCQMVGISYWDTTDGCKLSLDIKEAYDMPGGKELYWEQVSMKAFRDRYHVEIAECRGNRHVS